MITLPQSFVIRNKVIRNLSTKWIEGGNSNSERILFFIHGFPDTAHTFNHQFEYFKDDFLILAPFLRGLGLSKNKSAPIPKNRFSINSHLLDFFEIINHYDPDKKKKIIIVCHDIGGLYAWRLARDLGSSRASIVAINAPSLEMMAKRLLSPRQLKKSWYIAIFQIPFFSELLWTKYDEALINFAYRDSSELPPRIYRSSEAIMLYREAFKTILNQKSWQSLKKKSIDQAVPSLYLAASDDPFLVVPSKKEIVEIGENCSIRIVKGGHWLHRSEKDKINLYIKNFINHEGSSEKT